MNPYNLQTSALALVVAFATACGAADPADVDGRDESFLALMGSDGKADGLSVTDGSAEALAVLEVANTLSFNELRQAVGLDQRATANIVARRDGNPQQSLDDNTFDTLHELDATPWIGMTAFVRLLEHARTAGFVDAIRRPATCDGDSDCGDGVCHADRCYDVRQVPVSLEGSLTFGVASDSTWWARAHVDGTTTVRELHGDTAIGEVGTSTYASPNIENWVATLPDGALTSVTRSEREVLPEFGDGVVIPSLNLAVDAAYDADGNLFVAAEARDIEGTPQGLVVLRQLDDGWREELKRPFDGQRQPGEQQTTTFTRAADGGMQVWVDIDGAARRFDRNPDGTWRQAMVVDMAAEGFGDHGVDRTVEFLQAANGVVFIHRSTWNFARLHQVIRIEDSSVTAVIDMPTATRQVAPHADGTFTVLAADGALSHYAHSNENRGSATLPFVPTGGEIIRTRGDDLYVLSSAKLVIFTAR